MKIIGDITPKLNNEGYVTENGEYLGGHIVMLSSREIHAIRLLQEALKGENRQFLYRMEFSKPDDIVMDEAFELVLQFADAKFALNEFKEAIERLDNVLIEPNDL